MVGDVVSKPESSNSCCKVVRLSFFLLSLLLFCALLVVFHFISLWLLWVQWKDMYTKLEEKRIALRQAVKLLEEQIRKIQAENLNLKEGRNPTMMSFLLE